MYLCVMRLLLYIILAWLLYQFIFKLVIPVYYTSRKIKKGFREMQERMNEQYRQQEASPAQKPSKAPAGDYIDFEEIK